MQVNQLIPNFGFNPYASANGSQTPSNPAVNPSSAYGVDTTFFSTTKRASGDHMLTKALVGGVSGYKYNKAAGAPFNQLAINAVGVGAAISGSISIVKNLAALSHGNQSASVTVGNILTDGVQGGVSALGGLVGGAGTSKLLQAFGASAGTPLMIASVVGGAVGAVFANKMLNTEGLRSALRG